MKKKRAPRGVNPKVYEKLFIAKVSTEHSLWIEFMKLFRGRGSKMITAFMREAVQMKPVIVMEMKFTGQEVQTPIAKIMAIKARPVVMLDPETGEKLERFESASYAARIVGCNLSTLLTACRVSGRITCGFHWALEDDYIKQQNDATKKEINE